MLRRGRMETGQSRQKEVTHHLSFLFLGFSLPLRPHPDLLFLSWLKWDMVVFQCFASVTEERINSAGKKYFFFFFFLPFFFYFLFAQKVSRTV